MRLLIFGDSFCEYRAHLLTGMLAETVRSVMFVWSSSIDWDIVRDYRPNVVLTEMAERFIATVPADDLDLRAHAERKLAEALGKQGSYPELERRDFDWAQVAGWTTCGELALGLRAFVFGIGVASGSYGIDVEAHRSERRRQKQACQSTM